jgi:hypothetical protein
MTRIELNPKPSKWLFRLLLAVHGLAFLAVCFSAINIAGKGIVFLALFISCYYLCWLKILQQRVGSIVRCVCVNEQWVLLDCEGNEYQAELLGDSLVTTILIILNFRVVNSRRRKSLVLFWDSLDRDTFRRLRVGIGM